MGINFRAIADGEHIEHGPADEVFEPGSCSYCGGTEFEPQEDNGRAVRSTCATCGGSMVSSGGQFAPDLLGQSDNHPSQQADPASGGVGGVGSAPVVHLRTNDLSSRTAMPSRKHPLPLEHLQFQVHHHAEDDEDPSMFEDHDSRRPGWNHHTLAAHLLGYPRPSGTIDYSTRDDDKPTLAVHHMSVIPADRGKGIASAMQDKLRELHPSHMFDHGSRTEDGEGWAAQYEDPGDPKLDLDHPDNTHRWSEHTSGVDWCRHRHAEHCWLPRTDTAGPVALYQPQDRGICPWVTANQQQVNCPVSEPGPMAGMERTAKFGEAAHLSWDEIGERHPHIYGDEETHGKAAAGGDGEGVGWAANHLAHSRPDDPGAENTSVHDLTFHEAHVAPQHIDYLRMDGSDPRVRHARQGYRIHPPSVPPLVLVHRHGVYQVADGHHRAQAAALEHQPTVRAYVAHSPHPDEPFDAGSEGMSKGPYHGAEPVDTPDPHSRTAVHSSELGFHMVATWADVRNKAKRIRSEGGVSVVVASLDGIGGHVQGDTGVYETILNYAPGSARVANWTCGCAWAAYAWGRAPAYRRFEGRMCSHALALQFEAQSRGMFGRTIAEDTARPSWMRDKVRQRYDRDSGVHDLVHASLTGQAKLDPDGVYPSDHGLDLVRPPAYAFAVAALESGAEPAAALQSMLITGLQHAHARDLLHEAVAELQLQGGLAADLEFVAALPGDKHPTRCPDCGAQIESTASKCPKCGADLHDDDDPTAHVGSCGAPATTAGVRVAGVALSISDSTADQTAARPGSLINEATGDILVPGITSDLPGVHGGRTESQQHVAAAGSELEMIESDAWSMQAPPAAGTAWVRVVTSVIDDELGWDLADTQHPHQAMQIPGFPLEVDPAIALATLSSRPEVAGVVTQAASGAKDESVGEQPTHAGLVLKAADTGRVLMIQRSSKDQNDPAKGTWEWPGGGREPHDAHSLHSAIREFEEEVGQRLPHGGHVAHAWRSPNGVYAGHVVVIPRESMLQLKDGRVTVNPDDPDGDDHEQAAWWDPEHARKNPALRPECKDSPWPQIKTANAAAVPGSKSCTECGRSMPKGQAACPDCGAEQDAQREKLVAEGAEQKKRRPTVPYAGWGGPGWWLWDHSHPQHDTDDTDAGQDVGGDMGGFEAFMRTADYATGDFLNETQPDWRPKPPARPMDGAEENPGSTGFATAGDPPEFGDAATRAQTMSLSPSFAILDPDPQPALPSTEADDDALDYAPQTPGEQYRSRMSPTISPVDQSGTPNSVHAGLEQAETVADIVAAFQTTGAAKALVAGGLKQQEDKMDIASAARAMLAGDTAGPGLGKTALKDFTHAEQQALIGEGAADGVTARNLGELNIEGTHYQSLEAALAAQEQGDPDDLFD